MKPEDREQWLQAGRIAAEVREFGRKRIQPGALLADIVQACDDKIREMGGEPAFPSQISRNHIAAHYCPPPGDPTRVEPGDILKLDLGAHVNGFIADNAVSVDLRDGDGSPLMMASKMALENAIAVAGPGVPVSTIGRTIHDAIVAMGLRPVFNLTGHGVARFNIHCAPQIPNYDDGSNVRLKPGQTIAIEPFATDGKGYIAEVGKPEVFQQSRPLKIKDKLPEEIRQFLDAYHRLPFARRDLHRFFTPKESEKVLAFLRKKRLLHEYPPLAEKLGVRISQHEHTLMITEDGAIPTTRID